jgi:sarcosine reductase
MRLQLDIVNIKDTQFAEETRINDGVLYINRGALQGILEQDERLSQVEIELAHPGEKCRILQVSDVIEPRAKIGENGKDFPGAVDKQAAAGEGRTCVLRGAAVVISDYREKAEVTTSKDPHGEIIDMSGPGAEISMYGKTHNVVLLPSPKDSVSTQDYQAAAKIAGLKTAAYLARAGKGLKPDEIEVYDLPPLTEITGGLEDLPKVTYIFQILSLQFEPVPGEPTLYGSQAEGIVPTILHPNEVLDGAITSPLPTLSVETYHVQNHPIIKELYQRHGKDLCFTGVIITTAPDNEAEYERVANMAANLAKWVLGADGVVLTKTGGGAPELVMARTAQRCEQLGMKTAIALMHFGADMSDARYGASTLFSMPEVDAIVSMGMPFMELTLPPVERVIGRPGFSPEGPSIDGRIVRPIRWIKGSQCQLGSSKLTAVRY